MIESIPSIKTNPDTKQNTSSCISGKSPHDLKPPTVVHPNLDKASALGADGKLGGHSLEYTTPINTKRWLALERTLKNRVEYMLNLCKELHIVSPFISRKMLTIRFLSNMKEFASTPQGIFDGTNCSPFIHENSNGVFIPPLWSIYQGEPMALLGNTIKPPPW